jgi:periplasmic protein TonB
MKRRRLAKPVSRAVGMAGVAVVHVGLALAWLLPTGGRLTEAARAQPAVLWLVLRAPHTDTPAPANTVTRQPTRKAAPAIPDPKVGIAAPVATRLTNSGTAAAAAAAAQTESTISQAQAPPADVAPAPVLGTDFTTPSTSARADHRRCTPATHPSALRERGIEGAVILRVKVNIQGRADDVQLVASSGWRLFDEAAVQQAHGCHFHPAHQGGRAVDSWVEFAVRFELSNG